MTRPHSQFIKEHQVNEGGGTYRTFMELSIAHLTTETWENSKSFGLFRICLAQKKTAKSLFENTMVGTFSTFFFH